jgi:hypothetical protein
MLGFVLGLFEAHAVLARQGRDGDAARRDDDRRWRTLTALPRRQRRPQPLHNELGDHVSHRHTVQRGARLERTIKLFWQVDGGSHNCTFMPQHIPGQGQRSDPREFQPRQRVPAQPPWSAQRVVGYIRYRQPGSAPKRLKARTPNAPRPDVPRGVSCFHRAAALFSPCFSGVGKIV